MTVIKGIKGGKLNLPRFDAHSTKGGKLPTGEKKSGIGDN